MVIGSLSKGIIYAIVLSAISLLLWYHHFYRNRCIWKITNCCPETAGAKWECVDRLKYKPKIDCSKVFVMCPQFLSPKPNLSCKFENGECVVR